MDAEVDGSSDASDASAKQAEVLRQQGNELFKRRQFKEAKRKYSQAIALQDANHLLYGNRSAASHQLKKFDRALEDAIKAIEISPDWSKGYLRKGTACESLERWDEALSAYETFVRLEKEKSSCPDIQRAITRISALQKKTNKLAVKKGFLGGNKSSAIYLEKEDLSQDMTQRSWKLMLKKLLDGCNKQGINSRGERVVLDDGVFAKLLNEDEFQQLIYPGIPTEQLVHAPKNLQTLLEDPWYEQELLTLMPKVEAKAASVLNNVKKRGAKEGEIMDLTTERMLLPQVLQEAFGREVLAMVHRVNYQKHVQLANDERLVADPNSDFATWDQLDDTFLNELLLDEKNNVRGVAVRDNYMGEEWTELLLLDVERMAKNGLLMTLTRKNDVKHLMGQKIHVKNGMETALGAKLRFVEHQDCIAEYPALAELIEKVHALPYEINRKRADKKIKLCAHFVHCTAIHQLPSGHCQPLRLDCGTGENDNGCKLTCIYFFNGVDAGNAEQTKTSLNLRIDLREDAFVRQIEPKPDRLVLFQSQSVFNEITAVPKGVDLFYLTFWIHGQALG